MRSCLSPALNIWQTHAGGSQILAETLLWPSAQDGAGGEKRYQFCLLKCGINNSVQSNRSRLEGGMAGGKGGRATRVAQPQINIK